MLPSIEVESNEPRDASSSGKRKENRARPSHGQDGDGMINPLPRSRRDVLSLSTVSPRVGKENLQPLKGCFFSKWNGSLRRQVRVNGAFSENTSGARPLKMSGNY